MKTGRHGNAFAYPLPTTVVAMQAPPCVFAKVIRVQPCSNPTLLSPLTSRIGAHDCGRCIAVRSKQPPLHDLTHVHSAPSIQEPTGHALRRRLVPILQRRVHVRRLVAPVKPWGHAHVRESRQLQRAAVAPDGARLLLVVEGSGGSGAALASLAEARQRPAHPVGNHAGGAVRGEHGGGAAALEASDLLHARVGSHVAAQADPWGRWTGRGCE